MKMLHLLQPVPELMKEIIKYWPSELFQLWDNGDIVIKADSVSRWDGCWHFFTMTSYTHIHLVIPVNKCQLIRKCVCNEGTN